MFFSTYTDSIGRSISKKSSKVQKLCSQALRVPRQTLKTYFSGFQYFQKQLENFSSIIISIILISQEEELRLQTMEKQIIQQSKQTREKPSECPRTYENTQTKHLYDQVIRKNNETIKNLLGKLSSIYNRQQELEEEIKTITQKMSQLNKREDNFQYEMRSAQLESKKQQNIINNDISVIKNVLKIPSFSTPHEVYLSSNFFQERAVTLNIRRRDGRNKTIISNMTDEQSPQLGTRQQNPIPYTRTRHFKHRSQFPCNQRSSNNISEAEKVQQNNNQLPTADTNQINTEKLQTISKEIQFFMKKEEFTKQMEILQANFQQKIDKIDQKKLICNWHLDFEQIQAYIDKTVKETISQKVSKKYFEESLSNLKQAWQLQEKQIFQKLNHKLQQNHLSQILEKIQDMQMKIAQVFTLNSFRIPNMTYSGQTTPKGSSNMQSINDYFRADSCDTKILKKKKNNEKKSTNMRYSNPISAVGRCLDKKQASVPWEASTIQNSLISQCQWKLRASALVEPNLIKKLKAKKENIS